MGPNPGSADSVTLFRSPASQSLGFVTKLLGALKERLHIYAAQSGCALGNTQKV